jgi:hypothetical protein
LIFGIYIVLQASYWRHRSDLVPRKYSVRCAAVLAVFHVGDDDKLYRDEAAVARTTLAWAQAHSVCSRELVEACLTIWVIPCAAVLCHDIAPNCQVTPAATDTLSSSYYNANDTLIS